jgi:hypothetical protein
MVRSFTITAPTNLRGQVDREETTRAMFMKYSSQDARGGAEGGLAGCSVVLIWTSMVPGWCDLL